MKATPSRVIRWLVLLAFFVMGFTGNSDRSARIQKGLAAPAREGSAVQVIVSTPALSPPYQAGNTCSTFWSKPETSGDYETYLTFNVNDPEDSTNYGVWRPAIPQDGYYLVEAYIPDHGSTVWDCSWGDLAAASDTRAAHYTVDSRSGQKLVEINQSAVANGWVYLGKFPFSAGTEGYAKLVDLNDEANLSATVSFSAMRFTWVGPIYTTHLPALHQAGPIVDVKNITIEGGDGQPSRAFLPGEVIRMEAAGINHARATAYGDVKWVLIGQGDCADVVLMDGWMNFASGEWQRSAATAAPSCTGFYTSSFTVKYQNQTSAQTSQFAVSKTLQAFDKCNIPKLDQLQTWWYESPYKIMNLYIGGISRGCANSELTASWVSRASQQGWKFIPTWVGPQAPCSKYSNTFDYDPSEAIRQGRAEANAAYAASEALGLKQDRVIYYDLEGYDPDDLKCGKAATEFIKGWVGQLHTLGYKAGVYGSPCKSNIPEWTNISPSPDHVWLASWYVQRIYNPNASTFDVSCLVNSAWQNHQRIRQYAGDHQEYWGGVTLTIDSNAVDGRIASFLSSTSNSTQNLWDPSRFAPSMTATKMTSAEQGWAIQGGRLLRTRDGGDDWEDISPLPADSAQVIDAFFLDGQVGWAVTRSWNSGITSIHHTEDGGVSWDGKEIEVGEPFAHDAAIGFTNPIHGWIALRLQTSSSFSRGELLRTTDGGETWDSLSLPAGGEVQFLDEDQGWLAGGVSGDELYRTADGGSTWTPVNFRESAESASQPVFVAMPRWTDQQEGYTAVTVADPESPRIEIYSTQNGGSEWALESILYLAQGFVPGSPVPVEKTGAGKWLVGAPNKLSHLEKTITGLQAASGGTNELPSGVVKIEMQNAETGWAWAQQGLCSDDGGTGGGVQCELRSTLWKTIDGGKNWIEITPR